MKNDLHTVIVSRLSALKYKRNNIAFTIRPFLSIVIEKYIIIILLYITLIIYYKDHNLLKLNWGDYTIVSSVITIISYNSHQITKAILEEYWKQNYEEFSYVQYVIARFTGKVFFCGL